LFFKDNLSKGISSRTTLKTFKKLPCELSAQCQGLAQDAQKQRQLWTKQFKNAKFKEAIM
jgi:hypothetical protein